MTKKDSQRYTDLRNRLIKEFGSKCKNCDAVEELEFHHLKPTKYVGGWGRGKPNRVYDIKNNKDCFALLCKSCHRKEHYD